MSTVTASLKYPQQYRIGRPVAFRPVSRVHTCTEPLSEPKWQKWVWLLWHRNPRSSIPILGLVVLQFCRYRPTSSLRTRLFALRTVRSANRSQSHMYGRANSLVLRLANEMAWRCLNQFSTSQCGSSATRLPLKGQSTPFAQNLTFGSRRPETWSRIFSSNLLRLAAESMTLQTPASSLSTTLAATKALRPPSARRLHWGKFSRWPE